MYYCPYCGKWSSSKSSFNYDHILCKSFWETMKETPAYHDLCSKKKSRPTVNDSRNIVLAHKSCNNLKADDLWIPNWNLDGSFSNFPKSEFLQYTFYFWYWSEAIYQAILLYIEDDIYDTEVLDQYYAFVSEYTERLRTHDWHLENI